MRLAYFQSMTYRQRRMREGVVLILNLLLLAATIAAAIWKAHPTPSPATAPASPSTPPSTRPALRSTPASSRPPAPHPFTGYSSPLTIAAATTLAIAPGRANSGAAFYKYVIAPGTIRGIELGVYGSWNGYTPFPTDILHTAIDTAAVDANSAAILALMGSSGQSNISPDTASVIVKRPQPKPRNQAT